MPDSAHGRIGVITGLVPEGPCFDRLISFGLDVCQLVSWEPGRWSSNMAGRLKAEARAGSVRISAFWAGWQGPAVWDFLSGPKTLGIVPPEHRVQRVASLKRGGAFARELGVPAVITHLGFIPENAADPLFAEVVAAVRDVALELRKLGLQFWFETGQETPVTMLRLIQAVGTDNLGVNLDPANLILYGKGNPVDALDLLGPYVRNVHVKDGLYPTDPMRLGREVQVGEGRVRFPELFRRLHETGFAGELIIEREISGAEQDRDIEATVLYLRELLALQGVSGPRDI
jgi:sugar phosphate isomerase/epimerase